MQSKAIHTVEMTLSTFDRATLAAILRHSMFASRAAARSRHATDAERVLFEHEASVAEFVLQHVEEA